MSQIDEACGMPWSDGVAATSAGPPFEVDSECPDLRSPGGGGGATGTAVARDVHVAVELLCRLRAVYSPTGTSQG